MDSDQKDPLLGVPYFRVAANLERSLCGKVLKRAVGPLIPRNRGSTPAILNGYRDGSSGALTNERREGNLRATD